jgi:hypothetical protein
LPSATRTAAATKNITGDPSALLMQTDELTLGGNFP